MTEAVTFDFWNTLMWEEPGSLKEKRLEVWSEALRDMGASVSAGRLERAHDAAHERYVESWIAGRQFRVEEAVPTVLGVLEGEVPRNAGPALADGFSEAGRRAAIHPSDGVHDCLRTLQEAGVSIGIICDIGLTPSSVVRELLAREGLFEFFDGMSFSDEAGWYKPDPAIFAHALETLGGVEPGDAAHVGDRLRTDVGGAIGMGMTAVRYNRIYDDAATGEPEAHMVTAELTQIPSLLGVTAMSG